MPIDEKPPVRPNMPELDVLRGIAILLVLFHHGFGARYGAEGLSRLAKLFVLPTVYGWMGVNLFFALSGFLITGILLDTKQDAAYYRSFYIRRALRILPPYYLLLLILCLLGNYVIQGPTGISWGFLGLSSVYLSNVVVLFGFPMQFPILWSLAVEEHFYLLLPVLVRNLSRRSVGLCSILVCLGALGARCVAFLLGKEPSAHYTWLVADGLAFGSLLAVLLRGRIGTRRGAFWLSAGAATAALVLAVGMRLLHLSLFSGAFDVTALNLTCTAVVSISLWVGSGRLCGLFQSPFLAFFGYISYGLYLFHMLFFNLFDRLQHYLFPALAPYKGHFRLMLLRFVVVVPVAIAFSYLSRRYFEQPFLNLKKRLPNPHETRPLEVATSAICESDGRILCEGKLA